MKAKTITIYNCHGEGVIISEVIAKQFNLKNGQRIADGIFFDKIFTANAKHNIFALRSMIEAGKNAN